MKTHPVDGNPRQNPLGLSDAALGALLTDIFAQASLAPEETSKDSEPAFDPIAIRDMIREAAAAGDHPAKLVLGQLEADSYRDLLVEEYGEDPPKDLKDCYFLGLQIVEEDTLTKLALMGKKPHDAWDAQHTPPWKDDEHPSPEHQAA